MCFVVVLVCLLVYFVVVLVCLYNVMEKCRMSVHDEVLHESQRADVRDLGQESCGTRQLWVCLDK